MTLSNNRIAVFGCKQTSEFILDFLRDLGALHQIITISPELAEKNKVADYKDLRDYAERHRIPLYSAQSYALTSEADVETIAGFNLDAAFVIGWQRLIPENVLNTISIGCFGMHGSSMNLPLGRGRSPMNWSLIEGRKVFYTNLFKYDAGVDSGDVLDTFKFSISDKDDAETMHFKNMLAMRFLIKKNLTAITERRFTLTKQPAIEPTFYPKRTPADNIIDWSDDVYGIERFIRAVAPPFGGAFTFIGENKLVIEEAQVFDTDEFGYENEPIGKIVEILGGKRLLIKAFGGLLLAKVFSCPVAPKKGDICHNNNFEIKTFPTNKFGNYDVY